jgi:hypothetical protein
MFEIGTEVQVDGRAGVLRARVLRHHLTHDGHANGITRVEVLDPGTGRYIEGAVLDVATLTLWSLR